MTRVNIDILGISELKWMGMGEFNSDDHYIYHCEEEFLGRNGVALRVKKRAQNAVQNLLLLADLDETTLHRDITRLLAEFLDFTLIVFKVFDWP